MDKTNSILQLENLSVDYVSRMVVIPAVRGISFELFPGETYGLVGESGCGKSTVAFAVMGYTARNGRISDGKVFFKERDLTRMSDKELRKVWGKEISMVCQDPDSSLNPSMRVGDQVVEVLRAHKGLSSEDAKKEVYSLFESVRLADPELTARRYPHHLSGGMKQRVCIAMALALSPDLLIMDEPTTALDVTTEATILDLVRELRKKFNAAILYITHDLGVVARICDRVGVMYGGRLVEEANISELFRNPRHPYTIGLLDCIPKLGETKSTRRLSSIAGSVVHPENLPDGCAFSPRCALFAPVCSQTEPKLIEIEPGHRSSCDIKERIKTLGELPKREHQDKAANRASVFSNEDLLKVKHLRHYYLLKERASSGALWGRKVKIKAVDDVSFKLDRNRILGVVGESGCGKSTLARCIMGFLSPTDGSILFKGLDLTVPIEKRNKEAIRKISVVFQNPEATLNPKHPIGYAIGRPLRLKRNVASDQIREEVAKYLEAVNLGGSYADRYPRELSGGEKQRVAIARAFASNPELIVCDEPTSALDVSVQSSILNLLLDLQNTLGTSYLFISHDLSVVRYISDHIVVMYLGKFCEVGTTEEIFNPPYHPYTEALLSAIPIPDPDAKQKTLRLMGRVPSLINPLPGCRFHTRCPRKLGQICESDDPPELIVSETHKIYCHFSLEELKKIESVISK